MEILPSDRPHLILRDAGMLVAEPKTTGPAPRFSWRDVSLATAPEVPLALLQRVAGEPKATARLQRLAEKSLYVRYEALFRSIGLTPKHVGHELHLNRAEALLMEGRYDEAEAACSAALVSTPGHADAMALRARIARERGVLRRSVRTLRRLVLLPRPLRRLR